MAEAASDSDVGDRIRTILRRDLKLGNDIELSDETPFFSPETDLDSLDMLLLVSSIEKEFGIKVPNEQVGQEAFQNVRTLRTFIRQRQTSPGLTSPAAPPVATPVDFSPLIDQLPHGPSFRFISRVTGLTRGVTGQGVWSLRGDEPFFAGHFPGRPIVPGVLITESLAQLAGIVGGGEVPDAAVLAHIDVRFERAVIPPADLFLVATLASQSGDLQSFEVSAAVGGQIVARGTLALNRRHA